MKKTLLALTLATLPVAAFAEVTVYGRVAAGVESVKDSSKSVSEKVITTTKKPVETGLVDLGSRIGFKGQEDLGGGLKAIWQIESNARIGGTSNSLATRQSFLGLKGDFGTVRGGLLNTPLSDTDEVDLWTANADALSLGTFTRDTAVSGRTIGLRYDSPDLAGFTGSFFYAPKTAGAKEDNSLYSFGLNYANPNGLFVKYGAGFKANAYKLKDDDVKAKGETAQQHLIEAGYDANGLFVGVGFQLERGAAKSGNDVKRETKEVALSASYALGNVTPKFSYAHGFDKKDLVTSKELKGTGYDQFVIGADYKLSKRTVANVQAGWLRDGQGVGKTNTSAGAGFGLTHKF